jgi:2-keto-4-pentenoate hydratase
VTGPAPDLAGRLALLEQRLARLEEEAEITRLIATYGPLADAGDAEAVAALWVEDGVYDVDEIKMTGRAQILAMIRSRNHREWIAGGCAHFVGPVRVSLDVDAGLAEAVGHSLMVVNQDGFVVRRATANHWQLRRTDEGWRVVVRTSRVLDGRAEAPALLARAGAPVAGVTEQAARRLADAAAAGVACAPVRDLIGDDDLAAAYAVQSLNIAARIAGGARVVGRKIGLTSPAVQEQLGVDQPDFGWLFDDMDLTGADEVPMSLLLQPKAEAEIAFVLAEDLAEGPLDEAQIRASVAYAVAALEIVDSRIAGWDIRFGDTVADNASSGLYVLGTERRTLDEVAPVDVEMTMTIDGQVVSTGTGAACLGDPLNALAWLARTAREYGEPLRAGQVVLSGALGPMRDVHPGAVVSATISGLGSVTATFSKETQ